jgi:hypothetical protein
MWQQDWNGGVGGKESEEKDEGKKRGGQKMRISKKGRREAGLFVDCVRTGSGFGADPKPVLSSQK